MVVFCHGYGFILTPIVRNHVKHVLGACSIILQQPVLYIYAFEILIIIKWGSISTNN